MGSLLLAGGTSSRATTPPRQQELTCLARFALLPGAKGHRSCLARSRVMIHQPSGGASGKAADLAIRAEEILKTRTRLTEIYAEHCRVSKAGVEGGELESKEDCMRRYELALERDFFLDPEEALRFGLIDKVVQCVAGSLCSLASAVH